jgi:ethanolamine utilization protein EutM
MQNEGAAMPNLSLGTIEVLGLPAAVEAADVACKAADVTLIGYETTDGMGMVAVKIEGQVSAVQSAVAAASAAAARITKVFATSVIARPSEQLEPVVMTAETVGLAKPKPAPAPKPAPEPVAEPEPEPVAPEPEPEPEPEGEPVVELVPAAVAALVETPEPASTSRASDEVVVEATLVETPELPPTAPKPPVLRRPAPSKSRSTKKQ